MAMVDSRIPLLPSHLYFDHQTEYNNNNVMHIRKKSHTDADSYINGFHKDDEVCIRILQDSSPPSPEEDEDCTIQEVHGDGGGGGHSGDILRMQKLIDSMVPNVPSLGKPSSIDPFVNKTPSISGVYEWVKTILLLPLLVVRVLMVVIVMIVGFVATKSALAGWQTANQSNSLPRWRRGLMGVTRLCGRSLLFCCGFHWIHRIGRPARKEVAPIVVSNHVSFIDPIFYFYELFPSIVSSKSHDSIPLVGTVIRSMQVIPVDRLSANSRKNATIEIQRRAASQDFPLVFLFPEGTTTNGRALISFKLGAFVPGFPVQPVVIRYPFVHLDVSWGDISGAKLLFRMLTQFNNFMEVEYLPVVYPSTREQGNPADFAERVRFEMAQALCVPETEHTYEDLMLSVAAQKLKMNSTASFMLEMGRLKKLLNLKVGEVKNYLEKFASMDPTHSGTISMDQFIEWHNLPRCWIIEKIFQLFDKSGRGCFTFHELVAVLGSISKHTKFECRMRSAYNACCLQNEGITPAALEQCLHLSMPSITSSKVKQWFMKLDSDNDGSISWTEFQGFMEINPELLILFMVGTTLESEP